VLREGGLRYNNRERLSPKRKSRFVESKINKPVQTLPSQTTIIQFQKISECFQNMNSNHFRLKNNSTLNIFEEQK